MSLGGKKTSETKIDPDLKKAALDNLAMARKIGQLGPIAYTGDTVAGMQPGQIAAIQSGNLGANAFGLPTMAVPTGANLNPYSTYTDALANIPPAQRAFIESMFINPQTGAAPTMTYGNAAQNSGTANSLANQVVRVMNPAGSSEKDRPYISSGYYNRGTGGGAADMGQAGSGYTSIRDLYDGGGRGKSGSTFSGGPLSGALNKAGVSPAKPSTRR